MINCQEPWFNARRDWVRDFRRNMPLALVGYMLEYEK